VSANSATLRFAGAMGYLPMSLVADLKTLRSQWQGYSEAAELAGRTPSRTDWGVSKEVIVAETDAEAYKIAVESDLARFTREFMAPLHKIAPHFKALNIPDDQLQPEYLARHSWIVGSPATVREKLEEYQYESGGFGTLLVVACDFADQPEIWHQSLSLLAQEVAPRFS
jgi:alkanesulfonate monooxygenase SsuD/methylene tetrahydromethanopterin reductase-like flavin-dependent oxidoreductase (luciferase family)